MLCPASIGDKECITYLEVLSTTGTPGYEQFFKDVAMAWIELGGIPHWQKQWKFLEESCDIFGYVYIREKYGENIDTFKRVRTEQNFDPSDTFMNTTMAQLFKLLN